MSVRVPARLLATGLLLAATAGRAQSPVYSFGTGTGLVLELAGAPPDGGFALVQDQPDTGTTLRRPIVTGSAIPFGSDWRDLTEAQRQSLRAHYQDLPPGDEPPFPVGGLYNLYRTISVVVNHVSPRFDSLTLGPVLLGVVVAPDGHVAHVNVYAGRRTGFVGAIVGGLPRRHLRGLLDIPFKPGRCRGQPCQMEFPVEFTVAAPS